MKARVNPNAFVRFQIHGKDVLRLFVLLENSHVAAAASIASRDGEAAIKVDVLETSAGSEFGDCDVFAFGTSTVVGSSAGDARAFGAGREGVGGTGVD